VLFRSHCVGEKYITAVAEAAGAVPVLIPSLGDEANLAAILGSVDGILLTGSPSNVEPHRYAGPPSDPETLHDPHRDATTLPQQATAFTGSCTAPHPLMFPVVERIVQTR
jgi:putative glutamine amidotransferase